MRLVLIISFFISSVFAQTVSSDSLWIDKIDLVAGMQYEPFLLSFNGENIDNMLYHQKPVSGKLNFGAGHFLNLYAGLHGFDTELIYSFKITVLKEMPNTFFKLKNGHIIDKVYFFSVSHTFSLQYFFSKIFGLGMEYQINGDSYEKANTVKYQDEQMLSITLNRRFLNIYLPIRYNGYNYYLTGKIGCSILSGQTHGSEYKLTFINYQNPDIPREPDRNLNPYVKIKDTPHVLFAEAGLAKQYFKYMFINLHYRFSYEWAARYYSKTIHSVVLGISF